MGSVMDQYTMELQRNEAIINNGQITSNRHSQGCAFFIVRQLEY
jgi:hypothetical protein